MFQTLLTLRFVGVRPAASRLLLVAALVTPGLSMGQSEGPEVVVDVSRRVPLVEAIPLTGTVVAQRVSQLSAEVGGIVRKMAVDVGDTVETGAPILQLDDELVALSLAAAQAQTQQAVRELADARRRLKVAESLEKSRNVSANERDSLAAEVGIDGAVVTRYRAIEQREEARLRRHTLTAPFAGVISEKLVEEGEWVQPGQPVTELVAIGELEIEFQVPQLAFARMNSVRSVGVSFNATPGRTLQGTVRSVVPVADRSSRTFPIRVTLDDTGVDIAPGMSASAVMRLDTGSAGIVVPRDALIRYADGRTVVWVVGSEAGTDTVTERRVTIGDGFDGQVTVLDGLEEGEAVVVKGNEVLRNGQEVVVRQRKSAEIGSLE